MLQWKASAAAPGTLRTSSPENVRRHYRLTRSSFSQAQAIRPKTKDGYYYSASDASRKKIASRRANGLASQATMLLKSGETHQPPSAAEDSRGSNLARWTEMKNHSLFREASSSKLHYPKKAVTTRLKEQHSMWIDVALRAMDQDEQHREFPRKAISTGSPSLEKRTVQIGPHSASEAVVNKRSSRHVPAGRKAFSTCTAHRRVQAVHASPTGHSDSKPCDSKIESLPIRERLRLWDIKHQADEACAEQQSLQSLAKQVSLVNAGGLLLAQSVRQCATKPISDDSSNETDFVDLAQTLTGSHGDFEDLGLREGAPSHFREGDVVEYVQDGECQLAVFIRRFERQCQLYSMNGDWLHRRAEDSLFALPGFFNASDVSPIGKFLPQAEIPDTMVDQLQPYVAEVPRSVSAPLINKMQAFVREARELYRKNAAKIDSVYKTLANDKRVVFMTLHDIACKLFGLPQHHHVEKPLLWAIHQHLRLDESGILPSERRHWDMGEWEIIPRSQMDRLNQVRLWMRQHQECAVSQAKELDAKGKYRNLLAEVDKRKMGERSLSMHMAGFVKRAREMLAESRRHRGLARHGGVGPSSLRIEPLWESYLDAGSVITVRDDRMGLRDLSDNTILRFMHFWATKRKISPKLSSLGSMILRSTGMYGKQELSRDIGITFLQEMGVVYPWQNLDLYDPRLGLPDSSLNPDVDRLHNDALQSSRDFAGEDSMSDLRQDWGDMEVFCVDSSTAAEIDDGFSLETIPGDPYHHWIHVHVANPTAFLAPDHPVSVYAHHLTGSIYFPERIYSMLPSFLTNHRFSLDSDRPVLTISAKLSDDGDVVDHKITSGIIRKVTFMTPDCLTRALGFEALKKEPDFTYSVGKHASLPHAQTRTNLVTGVSAEQKTILSKLSKLASTRERKMRSQGTWLAPTEAPELRVIGEKTSYPWFDFGRHVVGDPSISVSSSFRDFDIQLQSPEDQPNLVSSLMILAGEVAGRWCSERCIPAVFRGTVVAPGHMNLAEDYYQGVVEVVKDDQGRIPYMVGRRLRNLWPQAKALSVPHWHEQLKTGCYIKATSPLRRYGDMVVHWQIEATLRREALLGRPLAGQPEEVARCLPFSREQMDDLIPRLSRQELRHKLAMSRSQAHWYHQLLFRAHHFKEDPSLPEVFNMYVTDPARAKSAEGMLGIVRELNCSAMLLENDLTRKLGGLRLGDRWQARIRRVNATSLGVEMEAVALVERSELSIYS